MDSNTDPSYAERSESFERQFPAQVEPVYRFHLARTGSETAAADLTEQTMVSALRAFAAFDPARGSFPALVFAQARRALAEYLLKHRRDKAPKTAELTAPPGISPDVLGPVSAYQHPDETALSGMVERRMQIAHLAAALRKLNRERADALALHLFGGLSLEDVDRVLAAAKAVERPPDPNRAARLVQKALDDLARRASVALEDG